MTAMTGSDVILSGLFFPTFVAVTQQMLFSKWSNVYRRGLGTSDKKFAQALFKRQSIHVEMPK